jgi:hypothetical protein
MSTRHPITRRFRTTLLFLLAAVLPTAVFAQAVCIPPATGIFGNFTPPHWWEPNVPPATYFENLDDPRWVGAGLLSYGDGTTNQADFRALHGDGKTNLYLSWRVFLAPAASANQNSLYLGLQLAGGAGDVVIHITLPTLAPNHAIAGATDVNFLKPDGTLDLINPAPALPWLPQTVRVWVNDPTANSFGVELRVPISAISVSGDTFSMWYELLAGTPGIPVFKFSYPRDPSGEVTPPSGFPALSHYPLPAVWKTFHLTAGPGDPSCMNPGVSLDTYKVGTHNSPESRVNYRTTPPPPPLPVNTFFAHPRNDTGATITAGTLIGRFRLANWGSMIGDESGAAPGTLWADIPGGGAVANVGPIPTGTLATNLNELRFDWTLTPTDYAPYENGTRARDNCLLVELTSTTGIAFTNNSVRRNMDFESASKMVRSAEISIKGLTPIAPDGRDVYLYIEALNLPANVTTPPPAGNLEGTNQQKPTPAQLNEAAAAGNLTDALMDQTLPTYRIHVFHDSGSTVITGADTRPVLRPQGGFGYRVVHQGDLLGWVHTTICEDCTLHQIAPNFYRINKVPNNGIVHVRTTIEAVEQGSGGSGKYRWFLDAGPNFPHGSFSNGVDGKFSVNTGIERILSGNNSVELILGYHLFDVQEVSKPHIWQLSVGGKHYFGTAPSWHPFVNGGIGAYRFDPGNTTKAGANAGFGVLYDLSSVCGIEGVYNYHWINTSGSSAKFSTLQIGIRHSF